MQDKRTELENLLLQKLDEDYFSLTTNESGELTEISINGSRHYFENDEDFWPDLMLLLGFFENIEEIDLDIPELSIDDISGLAKLTRLKRILLQGEITVSDLSPLAGLIELKHLHISKSEIHDLSPLSGLAKLSFISLPDGNIANLVPLRGLVNLQTLNLKRNKVADISPILALPGLQSLDLSENRLTRLPDQFVCPALKNLRVSNNQLRSFSTGVHTLQELSISGNPISDLSALEQLSEIKRLDIAHIKADMSFLYQLTSLTHLDAEDCGLNDMAFVSVLSRLEYLNLNNNSIGNNIPQTYYYSYIKELYLQNNGIDASVNKIAFYQLATSFLKKLDLRGNEFENTLLADRHYYTLAPGNKNLSEFRDGIKNHFIGINDIDSLLTLCYLDEDPAKEQVLFFINKLINAPRKDYLFRVHYLRQCEVILYKDSPFRNDADLQKFAPIIQQHKERLRKRMENTKAHDFTFKTARKLWLEVPPDENMVDLHILGSEIYRNNGDASLYLLKKLVALGNPLQYALGQCINYEIGAEENLHQELKHSTRNINSVKVPDFDVVDYLVAKKDFEKEHGELFEGRSFLGINWRIVLFVIFAIITIARMIKAMG